MKKETKEMMDIIHKNHQRAYTETKIENMLKEDRKKFRLAKERKTELSEHRAMTMMVISFVLLTFKLWGII